MSKGSVLAALTLGISTWVFWTETLMTGAILTPLQYQNWSRVTVALGPALERATHVTKISTNYF